MMQPSGYTLVAGSADHRASRACRFKRTLEQAECASYLARWHRERLPFCSPDVQQKLQLEIEAQQATYAQLIDRYLKEVGQ